MGEVKLCKEWRFHISEQQPKLDLFAVLEKQFYADIHKEEKFDQISRLGVARGCSINHAVSHYVTISLDDLPNEIFETPMLQNS